MKITVQNLLAILAALQSLDGVDQKVVIRGQEQIIKKPYKLAGKVRMKIARNLRVAEAAYKDYDAARVALAKQFAGGAEAVPADKLPQFNVKHTELLESEVPNLPALAKFTEEELNLNENPIAPTALSVILQFLLADDAPAESPGNQE